MDLRYRQKLLDQNVFIRRAHIERCTAVDRTWHTKHPVEPRIRRTHAHVRDRRLAVHSGGSRYRTTNDLVIWRRETRWIRAHYPPANALARIELVMQRGFDHLEGDTHRKADVGRRPRVCTPATTRPRLSRRRASVAWAAGCLKQPRN